MLCHTVLHANHEPAICRHMQTAHAAQLACVPSPEPCFASHSCRSRSLPLSWWGAACSAVKTAMRSLVQLQPSNVGYTDNLHCTLLKMMRVMSLGELGYKGLCKAATSRGLGAGWGDEGEMHACSPEHELGPRPTAQGPNEVKKHVENALC